MPIKISPLLASLILLFAIGVALYFGHKKAPDPSEVSELYLTENRFGSRVRRVARIPHPPRPDEGDRYIRN